MSTVIQRPIDEIRRAATSQLDPTQRAALGQFMTPSTIADFMASLFKQWPTELRLLDPGAGVGSLTEAVAEQFFARTNPGARLQVTAYEIDQLLGGYLADGLRGITLHGEESDHSVSSEIVSSDFIVEATFALSFGGPRFTHAILNPPYKKIGASCEHRKLLRQVGIETVNLYTAFLGLAVALTAEGGEIVAIVPRSFCNGTYFRPFRKWLLERVALAHIHVFESRKKAFREDDVLQENVIVRLERGGVQGPVTISTSHDPSLHDYAERQVPFEQVVKPDDDERFIHVPTVEVNGADHLFTNSLESLDLAVATGPVVDFRVQKFWLDRPRKKSAPLLYVHHFSGGRFEWPKEHKKPNALTLNTETRKWLMPRGWYVITRRFSAKEERRRIVAHVVDPKKLPYEFYGFENHLNVFHNGKAGLDADFAFGLALFLNSTIVDQKFRIFSGHTQVNATDLRAMRYPSRATLVHYGKWAQRQKELSQDAIDTFIESQHAGR